MVDAQFALVITKQRIDFSRYRPAGIRSTWTASTCGWPRIPLVHFVANLSLLPLKVLAHMEYQIVAWKLMAGLVMKILKLVNNLDSLWRETKELFGLLVKGIEMQNAISWKGIWRM
ncbi:UNVERIFIED_CONTAM: hypothetical protein Sindi_1358100 [Sesamum indicum]